MPRGRGKPLGGELQTGEFSTRGRRLFCEAFQQCHPEAVETLQHIAEHGTDEEIDQFCERYHLSSCATDEAADISDKEDWLRRIIWDTVSMWRLAPSFRSNADWFVYVSAVERRGVSTDHEDAEHQWKLLSQSLSWDPLSETEAAFRGRLERYIVEVRRLYESEEGVQASPRRRNVAEHYEWTVRFYVDGDSYETLAERTGRDVDTIRNAVRAVHDDIGLPRPTPGSRRRRQSR